MTDLSEYTSEEKKNKLSTVLT